VSVFNKEIDLVGGTDAPKVSLHTNTYTPNQDTHDYWDDATNEISGTGYTTTGYAITGDSLTSALNVVTFDSTDDPTWTSSSFTSRRAVYYDSTPGSSATNPLISWVDFGGDETVASGTFTIVQHSSGIANITATDATGFP
jgi:hypothetical protein